MFSALQQNQKQTNKTKQNKNKKTETLYLALEGILSRMCFKLVAAPHVNTFFFFFLSFLETFLFFSLKLTGHNSDIVALTAN